MTDLQAAILGFLQGATEWLPISSTAHLRVVPALCGWNDPGAAFTAVSQLGTLLAALVYFRRDILAILLGTRSEGADRRLLLPIGIGSIPIVLCGLLFEKSIDREWRSLYIVSGAMIGFALLLAVAEGRRSARRGIETVTVTDGLAVGIGQAFALIPGASRSGTTITASLFIGLERATAARFSFLLSLPAIFLSGVYKLVKERHEIVAGQMARPTILATAIAFLVGWASIAWLMKFLRTHPTYVFIVYRIAVGATILALLASGRLQG